MSFGRPADHEVPRPHVLVEEVDLVDGAQRVGRADRDRQKAPGGQRALSEDAVERPAAVVLKHQHGAVLGAQPTEAAQARGGMKQALKAVFMLELRRDRRGRSALSGQLQQHSATVLLPPRREQEHIGVGPEHSARGIPDDLKHIRVPAT